MGGRCVKGLWRKGGAWGFELRIFTGPGANPNPPFFLTFSRVCTPESVKDTVIVLLWDESGARSSINCGFGALAIPGRQVPSRWCMGARTRGAGCAARSGPCR